MFFAYYSLISIKNGHYEGLEGGGGVWISLISKNLAHYSLSLKDFAYSLK